MKIPLVRCLVLGGALGAGVLLSGCAGFSEGLGQFSRALEEQNRQMAYEQYLRDVYGPRPAANASAAGIK